MADKVKRSLLGRVLSNKMDQTIVVLTERKVKHRLYPKFVKQSSKIHAHDAKNECNIGDYVRIQESAPIAKSKTWVLQEVIEKAR